MIECSGLLAVQLRDDQDRRTAILWAIEQQGVEDVDVLHVFDHDEWHVRETYAWGWEDA